MSGSGLLPGIQLRLLGPVEIRVDGAARAPRSPLSRGLLTMLAAARDTPVAPETLIEELLGAGLVDAMSRNTLQAHMSRLRDRLDPYADHLSLAAGGYRLAGPRLGLDLDAVDTACAAARSARDGGDIRTAAALTASALLRWEGAVGEDLPDLQSVFALRARYDSLRLDLVEDLAGDRLVLGGPADVGVTALDLEQQVRGDPLRERAWALLMIAHAVTGRQGQALDTFGRARAALAEEAGLDPGPLLRRLQAAVLDQSDVEHLLAAAGLATGGTGVPAVVWLDGQGLPRHRWLPADSSLTIGRHQEAGVRLVDSTVSRWHAAIRRDGPAWVLMDLGSTNGTMLNGAPTTRSPVSTGDVIRCGDVGLLVTVEHQHAPRADGLDGPTDDLRDLA